MTRDERLAKIRRLDEEIQKAKQHDPEKARGVIWHLMVLKAKHERALKAVG